MDKQRIQQYKTSFDSITRYINNENDSERVEVWFARDLQSILGYARWENFTVAIQRAVDSCKTQGINVDDHFREVTKMVEILNLKNCLLPKILRTWNAERQAKIKK